MKSIIGIPVEFDFCHLTKVSDLIYFEGPLLSHYIDNSGENYIFYWIDVNESYNRWLFFRADLVHLQDFVNRKESLYDLITNRSEQYLYSVDIDADCVYSNVQLVLIKNLEESYLPSKKSFYESEPLTDVSLLGLSRKYKTGIMEFRITGDSVNYGSIAFTKLAPLIPKIEDIRKDLASKYIKNRRRYLGGDKDKQKDNSKTLSLGTQFELVYSLAGSFRLILRPIGTQTTIIGEKSFSDEFAEEIIKLFNSGFSRDLINEFSNKYNKNLIRKYNDLIQYLNTSKLGLDIGWCNNDAQVNYSQKISSKETQAILDNLTYLNYNDVEELRYRGEFYSINTHTGAYCFESVEGDDFKSSGFFDEKRKQMSYGILFNKKYDVVISRKTIEKVGTKEKINDTIISFIETTDA